MENKKILVVDDSRAIRLSVKTLLEKHGFEVLETGRVYDLFESASQYKDVSLILLDIGLPGMDGLTALEQLHQNDILQDIPVIMITGNSDIDNVQKAVTLGAVDFIRKPFVGKDLLSRVEKASSPGGIVPGPQVENSISLFAKIRVGRGTHEGQKEKILSKIEDIKQLLATSSDETLAQLEDIIVLMPFAAKSAASDIKAAICLDLARNNKASLKCTFIDPSEPKDRSDKALPLLYTIFSDEAE